MDSSMIVPSHPKYKMEQSHSDSNIGPPKDEPKHKPLHCPLMDPSLDFVELKYKWNNWKSYK